MQGLDRKRKTLFGDFVPGCLTKEEECHEWQEQYNWDQEGQKRYEQLNKETWKKGEKSP
jgi:hypothetical protein